MKCPYCGYENSDGAINCEMCEMPLQQRSRKNQQIRQEIPQTSQAERTIRRHQPDYSFKHPSVGCPNCRTPLRDCSPIVKTTIKSSGGGYGLFSGCCGTILLGPLGLLCGLRRQSITSANQTWWVCRKCGKEFVEKEAGREIADSILMNSAMTTGAIAIIWQVVFALAGYSSWVRNIALLAIAGTWMILPQQVKEATGYTMQQLMVQEERVEFYKKCAFYGIIAFFIGAVIGGKGMDFLLS